MFLFFWPVIFYGFFCLCTVCLPAYLSACMSVFILQQILLLFKANYTPSLPLPVMFHQSGWTTRTVEPTADSHGHHQDVQVHSASQTWQRTAAWTEWPQTPLSIRTSPAASRRCPPQMGMRAVVMLQLGDRFRSSRSHLLLQNSLSNQLLVI